jgi:hypothetical protein
MSSPVHLPPSPDSVPASPQHGMGMSDDEMRKLGITDPKVLAMILCHLQETSSSPLGKDLTRIDFYIIQYPEIFVCLNFNFNFNTVKPILRNI